jgi:hypothetical protein
MEKWKWEAEDAYAGPAHGAWVWIGFALALWCLIIWALFGHRH